ncbi:hypothetical protein D3C73_1131740 [compost metagenome]
MLEQVFPQQMEQTVHFRQMRGILAVNAEYFGYVLADQRQLFTQITMVLVHDMVNQLLGRSFIPLGVFLQHRMLFHQVVQIAEQMIGFQPFFCSSIRQRLHTSAAEIDLLPFEIIRCLRELQYDISNEIFTAEAELLCCIV